MKTLSNFIDNWFLSLATPISLIFIALYPKLPSISVSHTWVYIRLEDFVIAFLAFFWLIQLLRKKVTLPFPVAVPIVIYWFVGLCSLIFSLIFIGPHLKDFFPKIAVLSFIRRIEYMGLFFIAFTTIRSQHDVKKYLWAIWIILTGIIIYGFGQRWYLIFWQLFPKFFEKYPFCFPSFQTGNEEFAKGLALCLPSDARITSTFGGHYDLGAFLVLVIPIALASSFVIKNLFGKIIAFILTTFSVILLLFTASRVSFVAYIVGVIFVLIFSKRKKFVVPVVAISIALLFLFNGSTATRFMETFRIASVVTNSSGQVIGMAQNSLPESLQKKISKNPVIVEAPPPTQKLPEGSGFITLPQSAQQTTNVAVVQSSVGQNIVKKLKLANGGIELSTVSGSFLIQKALVYDISFTTRLQGEWPAAWKAFMRNPLLGSGYSSITLATDGDYHRALGETGILGLLSMILVFMCLGILLNAAYKNITDASSRAFVFGTAAGIIGLFFNATFIDVFEASKVAEPSWILIGVSTGILLSVYKNTVPYIRSLWKIFSSNIFIAIYLFIFLGVVFFDSLPLYFVADDFTWLHWAASSDFGAIKQYFFHAQGFFYRPMDKLIILFLYTLFSFIRPDGYHFFMLMIHFFTAFGTFLLLKRIIKDKLWSVIGAIIFLVLPIHAEDVYWISTISTNLAAFFAVYGVLAWFWFRKKSNIFAYICSLLLLAGGLFSYEMGVVIPLLFILNDSYIGVNIKKKKTILPYLGVGVIVILYIVMRTYAGAIGPNGDYSVNFVHLLPNIMGNIFGYVGMFFGGEAFLPLYTLMRGIVRQYAFLASIFAFVICILIIIYFSLHKKIIQIRNNAVFYGILFGIIALIPFVGLGNVTPRYIYLASIGWVIPVIYILKLLATRQQKILRFLAYSIAICAIIYSTIAVRRASYQWDKAGEITSNTLQILRQEFPKLASGYRLIFINVPIRYDNAWVFPVGLQDGIWFIYRDKSIRVYSVKTFDNARELIKDKKSQVKRFYFDKYGNLSQVD